MFTDPRFVKILYPINVFVGKVSRIQSETSAKKHIQKKVEQ